VDRRWDGSAALLNSVTGSLTIGPDQSSMPTFPEGSSPDLSFTGHAELRMEQRGVTERVRGLPRPCICRIDREKRVMTVASADGLLIVDDAVSADRWTS
jgi:hypothetical protein